MTEHPFKPGSRVVVRTNPHHADAAGIAGTVRKWRPGEGFAGTDLVEVEYEEPWSGERHDMPFATVHLSRGEPEALLGAAEPYEELAAKLRRPAGGRLLGRRLLSTP